MALATTAAPKPYKPYVPSPGVNPGSAAATSATVTPTDTGYGKTPAAPPAPPAPPATPTSDYYQGLLGNDSLLKQALAGINAAGVSDKASLTAGLQRGVIGYGGVPTSALTAPGLADALDQTTRDLASQNTSAGLSTLAKLKNAYSQSQQVSDADLAARGLLRSGAYGQHAADNLLTYNQNQDTATGQLMDYLSGLYNGYLSQLDQLRQQSYGATNDALSRIIGQIQAGQITAPPAPTPNTGPPTSDKSIFGPGGDPDPFANLNNLTAADWAKLRNLPINRKKTTPAPAAVPA